MQSVGTHQAVSATILGLLNIAKAEIVFYHQLQYMVVHIHFLIQHLKNMGIEVIMFEPEMSKEEIISLRKPNTKLFSLKLFCKPTCKCN